MAKATSHNNVRLALHADQESLWHNTGTDITADSAIPQSRWMLKLSRRTKK